MGDLVLQEIWWSEGVVAANAPVFAVLLVADGLVVDVEGLVESG